MSRWPGLVKPLIAHVRQGTGGKRTGSSVPADVETLEAFIRIARGPGTDDLTTDAPLVDVETFGPNYEAAETLAEDVREIFHALPGRKIGTVLVDRVRTVMSPSEVDYGNPGTVRLVASYRIEYRKG